MQVVGVDHGGRCTALLRRGGQVKRTKQPF